MAATTSKQGAMTRADFERLMSKAGCRVLYLPPYSPDLNPVELAWAFVKGRVRQCGQRADAARQQAVEAAIAAIPESFAPACFRHSKYHQLNCKRL